MNKLIVLLRLRSIIRMREPEHCLAYGDDTEKGMMVVTSHSFQ